MDTRIDRIDRALNFVARGDWVDRDSIRFAIEMPVLLLPKGGDTNRAGVPSKTGELDLGYPSSKGGYLLGSKSVRVNGNFRQSKEPRTTRSELNGVLLCGSTNWPNPFSWSLRSSTNCSNRRFSFYGYRKLQASTNRWLRFR